jgi:hypothetical protein
MVARTERSPGFGSSTRLPGFPSGVVSGGLAGIGQVPLQWRGRAGFAPASERLGSRESFERRAHSRPRDRRAQARVRDSAGAEVVTRRTAS